MDHPKSKARKLNASEKADLKVFIEKHSKYHRAQFSDAVLTEMFNKEYETDIKPNSVSYMRKLAGIEVYSAAKQKESNSKHQNGDKVFGKILHELRLIRKLLEHRLIRKPKVTA